MSVWGRKISVWLDYEESTFGEVEFKNDVFGGPPYKGNVVSVGRRRYMTIDRFKWIIIPFEISILNELEARRIICPTGILWEIDTDVHHLDLLSKQIVFV